MLGRKLDRHLLRTFLAPFVSCAVGLGMLLVLFDLFDRVDDCFRFISAAPHGKMDALANIGIFYANQVLTFLSNHGALAALTAGALAVAALARNSELTAMRATGVSLRRVFLPLVLFAVLCGAAQLWLAETVVCRLSPMAEDALDAINSRTPVSTVSMESPRGRMSVWGRPAGAEGPEQLLWRNRARIHLTAAETGEGGRSITGVLITVSSAETRFDYIVRAAKARWVGGDWLLEGGQFDQGQRDGRLPVCTRIRCGISPEDLETRNKGLSGVSSDKLYVLRDDPAARVELWRRWSLPIFGLAMMLVGLPLAVIGGARGGKLLPLGMALVSGALCVMLREFGAQMARSAALFDMLSNYEDSRWMVVLGGPSRLTVDVAMATPLVLFIAVGLFMYWRMDRN